MPQTPTFKTPVPGFFEMPRARMEWNGAGDAKEAAKRSLHLAIGIFDGVHLGHRAVIDSALACARQSRGVTGVLTFDPHPSRLLHPADPTLLLMPFSLKSRMLRRLGVGAVIWKEFDREFASLDAEEFLPRLREWLPTLASVHVGANFRFGQKRAGDVELMVRSGEQMEPGIDVFSVDRVNFNGEPISSSRIREELQAGDLASVNRMLGYSYASQGEVVSGSRVGRRIGFPTYNLPWAPELKPRYGVYCVDVTPVDAEPDGPRRIPAVANYGVRPSVHQSDEPLLELHLLGDAPQWPEGTRLRVRWLHFVRDEKRFEGLDLLREQIERDRDAAVAWFRSITS